MTAGHVYFVVWKIPHENYMSCRVFGGGRGVIRKVPVTHIEASRSIAYYS